MTRLLVFVFVCVAVLETSSGFKMKQQNFSTVSTQTLLSTENRRSTQDKPTPSQTPEQECALLNGTDCEHCVKNPKCLFCNSDSTCKAYPVGHVLPRTEDCKGGLSEARWGQCWINFEALIISMGVVGGLIILAFVVCICCCCCRSKGSSKKYERQEAKLERQREERAIKATERRQARQARNDEIRQKYGLVKEDNPYQRFDA